MSIVSLAAAADRRATVRAADGVELAVVESGRRTADLTVVLVHGHCASSESWTYVRAELSRRYPDARLVCYDHRGHGESAAAPAIPTPPRRAICRAPVAQATRSSSNSPTE
ncbi:alpha/beta fold hydrolase [Nocardia wallacei]|uniref:alpha/beta fold hydrolase n=1 Tax=Nocardia wallacei TaxID=480035 RepID=UPI00245483DC|nr:alpha/beta fold hydrolase [Nocardia wallacei]